MLIEVNDGVKEYWNEVKHLYPTLSYEQFQDICKNPFNFFKMKIETEEMPNIDIKYFGKFRVFESRIKRLLLQIETRKKFNKIREDIYEDRKTNLNQILKRIQDNDKERNDNANIKKRKTSD